QRGRHAFDRLGRALEGNDRVERVVAGRGARRFAAAVRERAGLATAVVALAAPTGCFHDFAFLDATVRDREPADGPGAPDVVAEDATGVDAPPALHCVPNGGSPCPACDLGSAVG